MAQPVDDPHKRIWELIKGARTALLITVTSDGRLDSRPMGCIQSSFEGTIWFMTFLDSGKVAEIEANGRVLISYADAARYEYVSLSGRAKVVKDTQKARELWSEGFRVWFPAGPESPDLVLISVDVDEAKYWTNPASMATYAWAYVRARFTGQTPAPGEIADVGTARL